MDIERIGKGTKTKIKYYKEIDSTHIHAKEIQQDGDCVLIAEIQTNGIGTKGRIWHTGKENNIAMTIIKHPECKVAELKGLTIQIAEKIQEVIKELYGYELKIKMPNDLILNGKKICGILTECNTIGNKINYIIISLGFNVNEDNFPSELENISTSLYKETGKIFDKEKITEDFIKALENII